MVVKQKRLQSRSLLTGKSGANTGMSMIIFSGIKTLYHRHSLLSIILNAIVYICVCCIHRLDLDTKGEIVRVGLPKLMNEGSYSRLRDNDNTWVKTDTKGLYLSAVNIELRSYSIRNNCEASAETIMNRCFVIKTSAGGSSSSTEVKPTGNSSLWSKMTNLFSAASSYETIAATASSANGGGVRDLVAEDLSMIPAVIAAIDRAWLLTASIEYITADALALHLVSCMKRRISENLDTIDLLISGVEVSLWIAEQFAGDMRLIFPQLNITTISANKLLSYVPPVPGRRHTSFSKVPYFSGCENITPRKIDKSTCILMISQSGQTFPTLQATRLLLSFTTTIDISKIWVLTGCFNSKMELALKESYEKQREDKSKRSATVAEYPYPCRVFNNYSGHRSAEPSTVAVVASYHTLTRMQLHVMRFVRRLYPTGRIVHDWVYKNAVSTIWRYYKTYKPNLQRHKKKTDGRTRTKKEAPVLRTSDIIMQVSDGCIADMNSLLLTALIPNMSNIVGCNAHGQRTNDSTPDVIEHSIHGEYDSSEHVDGTLNKELCVQGYRYSRYITEYYRMQYLCGCYVVCAVGFGLPFCGTLVSLIAAAAGIQSDGIFLFSPRNILLMRNQPVVFTVIGLVVQLLDALIIVFCIRYVISFCRIFEGIPQFARFGRRNIVIVDTPCVHQLLEAYVSKLFSQSFGYNGIDVHGASSLDHFVHKYTHRVARGVLLAIGRCDGRLCCLAKSEASTLLACKQAAFIQNPHYSADASGIHNSWSHMLHGTWSAVMVWIMQRSEQDTVGSSKYTQRTVGTGLAAEFLTLGHNPYIPDLGDTATHIVLPSYATRRKFVDEFLYERLFLATKPFPGAILRRLSADHDLPSSLGLSGPSATISSTKQRSVLPYGSHHIDPVLGKGDLLFPTFVMNFKEILCKKYRTLKKEKEKYSKSPVLAKNESSEYSSSVPSNNPGVRVAFTHKLDGDAQTIQDLQFVVQYFYENRIAALERYVSFCVVFHQMASCVSNPLSYNSQWYNWLLSILCPQVLFQKQPLWDIARSQSNLRIATTGIVV